MMSKIRLSLLTLVTVSFPSLSDGWPSWGHETAAVPFFFTSESLGNTVGFAGLVKGVGQPQAGLLGAGLYSDKGSYVTYLSASNYQVAHNWLIGVDGYDAKFVDYDYYLAGQGNNDSSQNTTTQSTGREARYRLSLRYVLPIGAGEQAGARAAYIPARKVTGSTPLDSGVSTIEIQPFYSSRKLDTNYNEPEETWGIQLKLDWDNRDGGRNPTKGSRTRLDITYSPEYKDDDRWTLIEFENSHYWDLGSLGEIFDKQVAALSIYTADTPGWGDCDISECHRPPEYERAQLGGLYRLRSFSSGRFHGRSAVHYSAEYRVMPDWQPLGDWPVFNFYDVPWWQWVAFLDVGRVADEYDLKTLHNDMKWSAGGAIRFQVEGIVVRTEMAWGTEDSIFRVMINQPF